MKPFTLFGLSQDQLMGLLRQLLPVFGGILVTLGWLTPTQVSYWTNVLMQVAGPLSIIAGVIWTAIANSKASIIASASAMPEVAKIELDKTVPGAIDMANAAPNNVVAK